MDELIKAFNKERKAHKGKWLFFHSDIDGTPVAIKSYNTWIQIAKCNGFKDGGPMDCSVATMNEWLRDFLTRTLVTSGTTSEGCEPGKQETTNASN